MKKFVSLLALASLMLSALYGCGSSGDDYSSDYPAEYGDEVYDENNNEYQEDETPEASEENAEDDTQSLTYEAELNEDGVYDLLQGDYDWSAYHRYKVRYMLDDKSGYDEGGHFFVYGNSDVRIPVFSKNETVAIYTDVDELAFIKITSDIHYAPDLDLADEFDGLGYEKAPYGISGLGKWRYNFCNSDEIEINGEDYDEFLGKHTINLRADYYGTNYFALIDAEKGEKFTIGGYEGTKWVEYDFYADVPFWYQDTYEKVTVPVEKTRNGYFTVDLSGLETGLYYNLTNDRMAEITE